MKGRKMNNLKAALFYHWHMKYSVIPVRANKKPFVKWEQYQDKPADEMQIRQWWKKHPKANVGLVCGQVSGINVVDVDTEAGWDALTRPRHRPTGRRVASEPEDGIFIYRLYIARKLLVMKFQINSRNRRFRKSCAYCSKFSRVQISDYLLQCLVSVIILRH